MVGYRLALPSLVSALFLLLAAPVTAQPATPSPSNGTIVSEIIDATQTLGILTVVILFVVGILALIVIFFVIAAGRLGTPLLGALNKANEARDELQEKLFHRLEAGDLERAKTADINSRTVGKLSELETRSEAQQARGDAVSAINRHTDAAHEETRKLLAPVTRKLDDVIELLNRDEAARARRDETLNLTISQATRELMELKKTVLTINDTGELPAASLTSASTSQGESHVPQPHP